ncbi:MAG: class I SAM-dependent methyltransferase [Verrucomicrobiota bacterium]
MESYSNTTTGGLASLREAWCLYHRQTSGTVERVDGYLRRLEYFRQQVRNLFDYEIRDRNVLDIGPGQFLIQMYYFSQCNRVVGIDCDVIAQGFDVRSYATMLKTNGLRRTAKTIIRKMLGVDRCHRLELTRRLGVLTLPRLPVLQMDACQMDFPDESFDVIYCNSVFHHLPQPETALNAISRTLKPGGVAYISLHLYTSENGNLDPRVFDPTQYLPSWAHLRHDLALGIQSNAFLNKMCLHEWREIFLRALPESHLMLIPSRKPGISELARELQANGVLAGYSLEELTTHELVVFWQKPLLASR